MLVFFIFLYFVFTLCVGFYASRKVKSAGDFINAGRNLHPAMNAAALFALWFGSETVFGASAEFAKHGIRGIIEDPLGGVLCLLLVGFFFSRRLYKLNVYTIGDLFRLNYGPRVELVSSILMILSFLGYAAAQIVALGLLAQTLLGMNLEVSMLLSVSVVVIYTFTGGMWAVSITDFLQSIFIVIGLIAIAYFVTDLAGGSDQVFSTISAEQLKFFPESGLAHWLNWFSAWMVLGFGSIASQDIFQRVNSARSEKAAYYSTLVGAILYLIFSMVPLYLILAIKKVSPELMEGDLQLVLPQMVIQELPLWVQILFFGSLLSAIMSTCSGALLAPASLLSENILKPVFSKRQTEINLLKATRFSVLGIGVLAYFIALSSQNIFELVGEASVIGLVTIFVPFVAALFLGHKYPSPALISMTFGGLVYMLFRLVNISDLNPLLPGFAASIVSYVLTFYIRK